MKHKRGRAFWHCPRFLFNLARIYPSHALGDVLSRVQAARGISIRIERKANRGLLRASGEHTPILSFLVSSCRYD